MLEVIKRVNLTYHSADFWNITDFALDYVALFCEKARMRI